MLLEDTPHALDWLEQFEVVDRQIARQMLRRLHLVSQSDFDHQIQVLVDSILVQAPRENFALITVSEPARKIFRKEHERRVQGSSADRTKHIIENLSRVHGDRVRANPTVACMRNERVRNVILVEDFIGTGDRIAGFWRERAPKSLKSWISYGWTRLWVASYAVMREGRFAMCRALPIEDSRIVAVVPALHDKLGLTEPMAWVARKYGERLAGRHWLGYGGGGGLIVFQHGCPNNVPAVLWCARAKFRPLFPDRGVPAELQTCFSHFHTAKAADGLWTFKQYRLALALLDREPRGQLARERVQLAIALGLASAYGRWDDERLQTQMTVPITEIRKLRIHAYRLDLIDKSDHRLSAFGQTLLDRMRRAPARRQKVAPAAKLPQLSDLYYPDSSGGVARH